MRLILQSAILKTGYKIISIGILNGKKTMIRKIFSKKLSFLLAASLLTTAIPATTQAGWKKGTLIRFAGTVSCLVGLTGIYYRGYLPDSWQPDDKDASIPKQLTYAALLLSWFIILFLQSECQYRRQQQRQQRQQRQQQRLQQRRQQRQQIAQTRYLRQSRE